MASYAVATMKSVLAVDRTVKLRCEYRTPGCSDGVYVHDDEATVTLLSDTRETKTAIDIAIGSHVHVIHTVCGAAV